MDSVPERGFPRKVNGDLLPVDRVDELYAAQMARHPDRYYRRGGVAVEIVADEIRTVTRERLIGPLDQAAVLQYAGGRNTAPRCVRPPSDDQAALLAALSERAPELRGIARHPVMRPDGSIASERGYDAATGLYIAYDGGLVEVDRETVLDVCGRRLVDFGFLTPNDASHALGMMIQPLVRPMIAGPTPLYVIDAATEGVGKTYLATLPITEDIVTRGLSTFRTEAMYQLGSALLSDPATLVLDNLPRGMIKENPDLLRYLTADRIAIREVGRGREQLVDVRTTWITTGIALAADIDPEIARRMIPIRLGERRGRPLVHPDLHAWIRENRPLVLSCLLRLASEWVRVGRPEPRRSLPSYGAWARVVGGIVELFGGLLGYPEGSFLAPEHRPMTGDDQDWSALIARWPLDSGEPAYLSVGTILQYAVDMGLEHLSDTQDRPGLTRLGMRLSHMASSGRVVAGHRIEVWRSRNGARYRPVRVTSEGPQADQVERPEIPN